MYRIGSSKSGKGRQKKKNSLTYRGILKSLFLKCVYLFYLYILLQSLPQMPAFFVFLIL